MPIFMEPGQMFRTTPVPRRDPSWTRAMLRMAHVLVTALEREDDESQGVRSEPGAYAHIHDQITRLTAALPDPPRPRPLQQYGAPVRLRCSATGRYIAGGLGLYVSAMDNSLNLDQVDVTGTPATGLPLPSDDACEAAHAMMSALLPGVL